MMKVRIGKTIFDSENEPIEVELSNKEKKAVLEIINETEDDEISFYLYPDNYSEEEIEKWLKGVE
jgi:hypothetical protein